jgi:hypothetical protein
MIWPTTWQTKGEELPSLPPVLSFTNFGTGQTNEQG